MAVGSIVARILTQYSDKGSKAASKDIAKLGKSFDKFGKKVGKAFLVAGAAAAAFAIKIGKDAVQAAIADQKSQALLANSLRNTTGATDSTIAATESYITQLQKQFSVVDDDLRPAFGRLAALTGSTTAAQSLLSLALDVSAQSGVDLATATTALIAGSRGQFRALAKLVPGLDAATLATKDYDKILAKVGEQTSGAAAKRAQTLEFRMMGLKIAFGEVLETLGYALLPVLETFAATLQTKLIPQFETFIEQNKDRLAQAFKVAAEFAITFLTVLGALGEWIANNTGAAKLLAGIIAGMFVVSGIASFIVALGTVSAALVAMRALAVTTAVALAFATGGTSAIAGAVGAAAVAAAVGGSYVANKYGASLREAETTEKPRAGRLFGGGSGGPGGDTPLFKPPTGALTNFTNGLKLATAATKKSLNEEINAAAAKKNLARQATLSGSSTIAIGASGSRSFGNRGMNVSVNVAGSVSTENDLITAISDGLERTSRRSFGSGSRFRTVAE